MIIDTETKRKLREMNATDLLDAFERLDEQTTMPLSHTEVIRLAVDSAHSGHMDARIQRLVKRCVCSIESGPCERVESLQMSGRF